MDLVKLIEMCSNGTCGEIRTGEHSSCEDYQHKELLCLRCFLTGLRCSALVKLWIMTGAPQLLDWDVLSRNINRAPNFRQLLCWLGAIQDVQKSTHYQH